MGDRENQWLSVRELDKQTKLMMINRPIRPDGFEFGKFTWGDRIDCPVCGQRKVTLYEFCPRCEYQCDDVEIEFQARGEDIKGPNDKLIMELRREFFDDWEDDEDDE